MEKFWKLIPKKLQVSFRAWLGEETKQKTHRQENLKQIFIKLFYVKIISKIK